MTHGIDTDFLVACEIRDHQFHQRADALLASLIAEGHDFAVAPQSLAEFIHIVTDPKRLVIPLSLSDAISRANHWWHAAEVVRVFPDGQAVTDFFTWLNQYQLGRKRLLDTLLAAPFRQSGITRILSNNVRDFRVFGCFEIIPFSSQ